MRQFAIVVTFVEFVLSMILYYNFDINSADVQFMVNIPIIKSYGINYLIGADGIIFVLIIMITFMTMIAVIGLTEKEMLKPHHYNAILEMTMVGVLLHLMLFYFIFFGTYYYSNVLYYWILGIQ